MQSGRADQNSAFEHLNRVGARAVRIHCGSSRKGLIRDVAIQTPGLCTRDVSRSVLSEFFYSAVSNFLSTAEQMVLCHRPFAASTPRVSLVTL
jgi:hypothetical protein